MSSDLQWSNDIANLTKKVNSTLGFLRRNLNCCPQKCRLNAYISREIDPQLRSHSVGPSPEDFDAIKRTQRTATRLITGDYKSKTSGSIQRLLTKLDLPSLQERRKSLRLVFLFKVVEGLVPAMPSENFLTPSKSG